MPTSIQTQRGIVAVSTSCRSCGATLEAGKKFCTKCGTPIPPPSPPVQGKATCSHCGTAVIAGGRFCANCGAQITAPAPAPVQTPPVCPKCGTELTANAKFCSACGAPTAAPPRRPEAPVRRTYRVPTKLTEKWELPLIPVSVPPRPPLTGQIYAFKVARFRTSEGSHVTTGAARQNVPLSSHYWGFQDQTTNVAAQVIRKLNESGFSTQTSFGRMVARMIQGALLDKAIYRQVAADSGLQTEAWKVMGLVILVGTAGLYFFSLSFLGLMPIVSVGIIQLIAWLAKVWVVQVAASAWFQKQISFDQLFRPLAYAQSPAILQIIPTLSPVVGLWCVVTNTAAIRDVTGCDTSSAAILAVIGVIGVMIATSFAGPIVQIFF